MKKIFLNLFIIFSLFIGANKINAANLECVYDIDSESQYVVTYDSKNIDITLKGEFPSVEAYHKCFSWDGKGEGVFTSAFANCNSTISITNFEEDGFICPDDLIMVEDSGSYYYGFSLDEIRDSGNIDTEFSKYKFSLNEEDSNEKVEFEKANFKCDYTIQLNNLLDSGIGKDLQIQKFDSGYKAVFQITNPFLNLVPKINIKNNAYGSGECEKVEKLYTNCNKVKVSDKDQSCEITTTRKKGYTEVILTSKKNPSQLKEGEMTDGTLFINHLGKIKSPLKELSTTALSYNIYVGNTETTLKKIQEVNVCENNCDSESETIRVLESEIKATYSYCNQVYAKYGRLPEERILECNSFIEFYNKLVDDGILNDLSEGCDLISSELFEFLNWLLDVLKIAGPILAILYGSLDFVKVLFNGDADKELKEAFKRFKTRIIAVVLLFVIPLVLSFLMNTILVGQDGYDENNPFCDIE